MGLLRGRLQNQAQRYYPRLWLLEGTLVPQESRRAKTGCETEACPVRRRRRGPERLVSFGGGVRGEFSLRGASAAGRVDSVRAVSAGCAGQRPVSSSASSFARTLSAV